MRQADLDAGVRTEGLASAEREVLARLRRTVARLMRARGIVGVVRGKRRRTTVADPDNPWSGRWHRSPWPGALLA